MNNTWVIFILAFLFFDLIVVIFVFIKRAKSGRFSPQDLRYIKDCWLEVEMAFEDEDYKIAVLDADKILNYALEKKGFGGTLGEKLKSASYLFSDLDGIWYAHKIRNRLAHELIEIDEGEIKTALKKFKQGLFDLGVRF